MKSIIFPTDFSRNGNHALAFAKRLAIKKSVQLSLIHVYSVPLLAPENIFTSRETTMAEARQFIERVAMARLKELVKINDLIDYPTHCSAREGNVSTEIVRFSEEENADLIVMGTQGETANRTLFIGSVTAEVIRKSKCPVLAIPQDCELKSIQKILYTTELTYDESPECLQVIEMAKTWGASVTFLHVNTDSVEKQELINSLEQMVDKTYYEKLEIATIKARDISEGINGFIAQHQIDMLAMTTHTKSLYQEIFHTSEVRRMVLQTRVPLLAFSRAAHSKIFL